MRSEFRPQHISCMFSAKLRCAASQPACARGRMAIMAARGRSSRQISDFFALHVLLLLSYCGWLRHPFRTTVQTPWNDSIPLQMPNNTGFKHGFISRCDFWISQPSKVAFWILHGMPKAVAIRQLLALFLTDTCDAVSLQTSGVAPPPPPPHVTRGDICWPSR